MDQDTARLKEEVQAQDQRHISELADLRKAIEEEKRLRRKAEVEPEAFRLKSLFEVLEACHTLFHAPTVITDKSLATQSDATDPANRKYPRRIIPWHTFIAEQDKIWGPLLSQPDFQSRRLFSSSKDLDTIREELSPIRSEIGLRAYTKETVENHVKKLIEKVFGDKVRDKFGLLGKVFFESHTKLEDANRTKAKEKTKQMSTVESSAPIQKRGKAREQQEKADKIKGEANQSDSKSRIRGKCAMSDQFVVLQAPDEKKTVIMAVEYKAPYKFSLDNMIAGLSGEIRPADQLFGKEDTSFEFLSKHLAAAVITQLFSRMKAEKNSAYRTAIAEVSAFVVRAIKAEAPDQSWYDEVEKLPTWPMERVDILKDIPLNPLKSDAEGSEYKPESELKRPNPVDKPIRASKKQRQGRKEYGDDRCHVSDHGGHDDDDDKDRFLGAPLPFKSRRRSLRVSQIPIQSGQGAGTGAGNRNQGGEEQIEAVSIPRIQDRPYCTHACLLGLAHGGEMDRQCLNFRDHSSKHINQATFLRIICEQLDADHGSDSDCKPLNIKGSRGALFKIRQSSHRYTMVAKGVEWHNFRYLEHEHNIYKSVRSIQGKLVPVCLGYAKLGRSWQNGIGKYFDMLLLSWAGRPLYHYLDRKNQEFFVGEMTRALESLHNLQVLHRDAELRNILWDEQSGRLMFVDFERAELPVERPILAITPDWKGEREDLKRRMDTFAFNLELMRATQCISKCVRRRCR